MSAARLTAEDVRAITGVSRETIHNLSTYVDILRDWQTRINLVGRGTLDDIWGRHILDSAQLSTLIPDGARTLLDIGSGAGFPGLVLAIMFAGRSGFQAYLNESTLKKCAFLEAAIAATGAPAKVIRGRAEDIPAFVADVVTARAVGPLAGLLGYASRFKGKSTICLFPKGQNTDDELTDAMRCWKVIHELIPSQTNPSSRIVVVRSFARVRN